MASLEDRVTALEIKEKITEDELDRISSRMENRFDRIENAISELHRSQDAAVSELRRSQAVMETKLDVILTKIIG